MASQEYIRGLYEWRAQLDSEMRRDFGWLTLIGQATLKEGINTLGSSPDCDVPLPKHAPRLLAAIDVHGNTAVLRLDVGQSADVNGFAVRAPVELHPEGGGAPASMISSGELRMLLLCKDGRSKLRIWDNTLVHQIPPRTWFDVDEKYRVRGSYSPYPVPGRVEIPNSEGKIDEGYVQGSISFKLGGKSYSLEAAELDDGTLYVPFRDWTNGLKTYPRGRYLSAELVSEDGLCLIDFNRAYNPPCAFKESERCSFAPMRNELKVAIEAGELYSTHH